MRGRRLYKVDPMDRVEGPVDSAEAHDDVVLHRSGVVFLKRPDGEFMVRRHALTQRGAPGLADASAAFHVEFGDSYADAAARELRTEVGVVTPLSYVGKFRHLDPPEHQIVAVFTGTSSAQLRPNPLQSLGWDWLTKKDVDGLIRSSDATPWMVTAWRLVRDRL